MTMFPPPSYSEFPHQPSPNEPPSLDHSFSERPSLEQPLLELRSDEVQDIITSVPAWIVRWGTTLFFLLLILLLGSSWLIYYPDVVTAPFRLTARNAPKSIRSRTEGKLVKLFVYDQAPVQRGAVLAFLESTAEHEQILALDKQLDSLAMWIKQGEMQRLPVQSGSEYDSLGELQPAYQTFNQAYTELMAHLENGFYLANRNILKQELAELLQLDRNLKVQQAIYQRDFHLAQQEYEVQQQLAREKVIAPLDLKREESKLLSREMPLKQIESAIVANHSAHHAKRKEILEADKLITEQRTGFVQSLYTFQSAVETWKQKYILTAPMNGNVYFSSIIEENQPVSVGQEVFYVAPPSRSYYGELHIPQNNLGKVKVGQRVLIKFAGYPYQEFGAVEGKIDFISALPDANGSFLGKVILPKGLQTNNGKPIHYRAGMTATSEIITQNLRLLERFYFQIRSINKY